MRAPTPDLLTRFCEHVSSEGLFDKPGRALVAVSGGLDSVVLLDLMAAAAPTLGLELRVGHVHHGITAESEGAVEVAREVADRNRAPCVVESLDLGPGATETLARERRYQALRSMQAAVGALYLVTAHHADDQLETVLQRVLRGSGVAGLAGIPACGPEGLRRPLLPFYRRELAEWFAARQAGGAALPEPFDDPENAQLRHDRAWLRHEILPLLRDRLGHSLEERLLDLSEYARRDNEAWSALLRTIPDLGFQVGDGFAEVARDTLATYDKLLCERILRAVGREAGLPHGTGWATRLTEFVAGGSSGRAVQLGGGWKAELVFDRLRLVGPKRGRVGGEVPAPVTWGEGDEGSASWGEWSFRWRCGKAGRSDRGSFTAWVTPGPGEIRALQSGDRMRPLGGVGRRAVRRLLMEARVPKDDRQHYPIVVRAGHILWIPGICRSAAEVPEVGEPALQMEACAAGDS